MTRDAVAEEISKWASWHDGAAYALHRLADTWKAKGHKRRAQRIRKRARDHEKLTRQMTKLGMKILTPHR
jgi:hypothetical protein